MQSPRIKKVETAHSEIIKSRNGESYVIYIKGKPLVMTKINHDEALYTYENYTFTFFIDSIPTAVKDFFK